ncbi:MAG: aromatic-ring-hydroxylating dioxygenase subunit beta [Deltaproteobacteria bacterium]|nr:aromatic-ring-hydroxylating dioxygenase subunit beta [Deltaproteobacteria bacterium]
MITAAEHRAVEAFLYKEARLADESRYNEWEALWEDDAIYWVPATTQEDADPNRHISHIYDNRARIATRLRLLKSGFRYSQTPASSMRRLISNIEIEKTGTGEFVVGSNFLLVELSLQAKHETHLWAGHTIHQLRAVNGELKMFGKKVMLVNAGEPIPNLTFLI